MTISINEIVTCKDCNKYIRIGYDAIEVKQNDKRYGITFNCKDCYTPNKNYMGDSVIVLDSRIKENWKEKQK